MGAVRRYAAQPESEGDIRVTVMPLFDPGEARLKFMRPYGTTIEEIISFPRGDRGGQFLPQTIWNRIRVYLTNDKLYWPVERENWHRVKPKAGTHVVIRVTPAGPALAVVANLLVTVAAQSIGSSIGGALGLSTWATNLLTFAIPATGGIFSLSGLNCRTVATAYSGDSECFRVRAADAGDVELCGTQDTLIRLHSGIAAETVPCVDPATDENYAVGVAGRCIAAEHRRVGVLKRGPHACLN